MSEGHLRIHDLSLAWPDGTLALDGVDLEVAAGTSLVLLGGSGAGKTTLLRVIAGLERPERGRVALDDRVLTEGRVFVPPEDRGVGVVFQALELWDHMSVAEHVAFALPGRPRGRKALRDPRVALLATDVGLPLPLLSRRPTTLSGGEQQRVAIARTLAAKPDVILYDEPLANLDPELRRGLRALIRRLAREQGTTVVYVTHDPHEALELGHAVAILEAGRVLEYGTPSEVYAHPKSLAAARALGPVSALPGEISGGVVVTPLGRFPTTERSGACTVLWRPEAIRPVTSGGALARIVDAVALGPDWQFTAVFDEAAAVGEPTGVAPAEARVHGRSAVRPEIGAILQLAGDEPAAILASAASPLSAPPLPAGSTR